MRFARSRGHDYIEVSAMNGQHVTQAFELLGEKVLRRPELWHPKFRMRPGDFEGVTLDKERIERDRADTQPFRLLKTKKKKTNATRSCADALC